MGKIIKLMRPHHWVKNGFIFLPLFFAHQLGNIEGLISCVITFVAFSLVASSVYVLNDIRDAEQDRLHPRKCNRPIASGAVSVPTAVTLLVFILLAGIGVALFADNNLYVIGIILSYFVMNILYTFYLKRFAIIDVVIIAIGFVLRVVVGGVAADVELSNWIILMTFLLALFLGFAKRRDDVIIYENDGTMARANVSRYNEKFIDSVLVMTAAISIVAYIMYCMSPDVILRMGTDKLYITSFFVIIGMIRYLQRTMVDKTSGNPTRLLLKDRFLQITIIGWVATFVAIIYFDKL